MSILASCKCGREFEALDAMAGRRVKCPACGQQVMLPSPRAPQPSQADFYPPAHARQQAASSAPQSQHVEQGASAAPPRPDSASPSLEPSDQLQPIDDPPRYTPAAPRFTPVQSYAALPPPQYGPAPLYPYAPSYLPPSTDAQNAPAPQRSSTNWLHALLIGLMMTFILVVMCSGAVLFFLGVIAR